MQACGMCFRLRWNVPQMKPLQSRIASPWQLIYIPCGCEISLWHQKPVPLYMTMP